LYDSSHGDIHQFIEVLDKTGMKAIETLEPEKFTEYIKETKNTICGRMPITLLLQVRGVTLPLASTDQHIHITDN